MKLRFVTIELLRYRHRVRHARERVRHKKQETKAAFERFTREKLATPGGIAACAAAGLLFERVTTDTASSRPLARIQAAIRTARDTMALIDGLDRTDQHSASDKYHDTRLPPTEQVLRVETPAPQQAG